jgi:hypothetical protein
MSSKEPTRRADQASSKKASSKRMGNNSETLVPHTHPVTLDQQAGLDPRSLTPGDVVQLQHTLGNQTVGRLLTDTGRESQPLIQRKPGDPLTGVAEAEYAKVTSGQTINYTKLAAGCMAVTACFSGGGGVGYHFAMMVDNAAQWKEFLGQIGTQTLSSLSIDSDMVGEKQGWWVRYEITDPDFFTLGAPITTQGPLSYAALKDALKTDDKIFEAGWVFDQKLVSAWFKTVLGVAPTLTTTQSPGPYTL